jgi:integrase
MSGRVRKLRDGTEVAVHANDGVRKMCKCPRSKKSKCNHPWHFNYQWKGKSYRFSLNRHLNNVELSKSEAEREAERLRTEIRHGRFGAAVEQPVSTTTFEQFSEDWKKRRGYQLVRSRDNDYRITKICEFILPDGRRFGDLPVVAITPGHIEAFRHARRESGLSAVTINHDLKLLRKMLNWGIRERLIEKTPFKIGTEAAIRLERETPRNRRFANDEDEERLLQACSPFLRAFVTTMLDTCCRPGELLTLQWKDVDLERREITVQASKAKTREGRMLPMTARVHDLLEMRRLGPDGEEFGPEDYVFGDELGKQRKSVRVEWQKARTTANLGDMHVADLRHEAASRYEECGVPTGHVSKFLGHSNLGTTTRYLNATRRGLKLAVEKLENARLAKTLQTEDTEATETETPSEDASPLKSAVS